MSLCIRFRHRAQHSHAEILIITFPIFVIFHIFIKEYAAALGILYVLWMKSVMSYCFVGFALAIRELLFLKIARH